MSYQTDHQTDDDYSIAAKFAGTIIWAVLTGFVMLFHVQTGSSPATFVGAFQIFILSPILSTITIYFSLDLMLRDGEWRTSIIVLRFIQGINSLQNARAKHNQPK